MNPGDSDLNVQEGTRGCVRWVSTIESKVSSQSYPPSMSKESCELESELSIRCWTTINDIRLFCLLASI